MTGQVIGVTDYPAAGDLRARVGATNVSPRTPLIEARGVVKIYPTVSG